MRSEVHRGRARAGAIVVATAVALLIPPGVARADHVGSVSITPPTSTIVADVCGPFLVRTQGGTDPVGAIVDVEVIGATQVDFCLPDAGVNPVLIDPATGDLGDGTDGTIGGEAAAEASTLPDEGDFTLGIVSPASGSYEITVFVEEPGGPDDNDDPDSGEPQDGATATIGTGGGGGGGGGGTKVDSTVTLNRNLSGRVGSSDAACEQGRRIVVKKVRPGRDRVVGRDRSDQSGAFRVNGGRTPGRYYAIVKKKKGAAAGGGTCMRAKSRRVTR